MDQHAAQVRSLVDGDIRAVPLFLGANPASVRHDGAVVSRPLGLEEDVAPALVNALDGPALRAAVVAHEAPADICTGRSARVAAIASEGVPASVLSSEPRQLLHRLVEIYLGRLAEPLARHHRRALDGGGWDHVPLPVARAG